MKKILLAAALAAAAMVTMAPAGAILKSGDKAPAFTAPASMAGKEFNYALADQLKKGPVVLYFYPAAFTKGCTIEAHAFAEAVEDYAKLGATVVGVSNDNIDTLNKFSVSECQSKFAVVADNDQKIMKSYDSILAKMTKYSTRVSYVISPKGEVIYAYDSMDPDKHVENTMTALKKWVAENKAK
jgi:peroxiredoxin